MTLVLDIEHLLGAAFAAREPDNPAPDWPPQPDRVFSALVASWGAHGEPADEKRALEWLEAQPAPDVAASGGFRRTAPVVFVPPNDPESGRGGNETVLPSLRRRQPRRFPAFRPHDRTVTFVWRGADPDGVTLAALNALAADTAYVGHSASLTRCRFRIGEVAGDVPAARRRVYPGRLAELKRDFDARPLRRPRPGASVADARSAIDRAPASVFSDCWLVLEHIGGEMPDIRAAALVAKAVRNALMSGYRETGAGEAIPAVLSGHLPDRRPTSDPHLAIAPLAFLGWPHASGTVLGLALIPPRSSNLFGEEGFRNAVRAILKASEDGRQLLGVQMSLGAIDFAFGNSSGHRSLDPARYVAAARVWATCTPLVLDRHLKETDNRKREQEIVGLIQKACGNIGLPEPCRVSAGKHSAIEGAPSASPSGPAPRWLRWRLPDSLASRQLVHAVIEFPEPVAGPLILGAGRFVGLGLCLPLDVEPR